MRFLSLVRITETGRKPSQKLITDMGRLMAEMSAAGVLLETAGLRPTSEGKRVRLSRGQQRVTDGPFAESKEVVGGYAMLNVASMDEALKWTARFLDVHGSDWEVECEVRQVDEGCAPEA